MGWFAARDENGKGIREKDIPEFGKKGANGKHSAESAKSLVKNERDSDGRKTYRPVKGKSKSVLPMTAAQERQAVKDAKKREKELKRRNK